MEKAKQAAASFLSKDGKHKTSVDQDVRGAVTEEHVHPHQHENITTAVDKEVHQDHHQTRIQPVKDHETLAETSSHVVDPVQHRTFHHGDESELRTRLQKDASAFKDSSVTHETTHSSSAAPVVAGERVHHHVHEHIQPVIQKDTTAPHVIHRTAPVHETHHAAPIHHEATTLPVKTLDEFTSAGGSLDPKATSTLREFDGCPGPYNKERDLPSTALHQGSPTESSSGGSRAGLRSADNKRAGVAGTENLTGTTSGDSDYTYKSSDKRNTGLAGAGVAGAGAAGASSTMKDTTPRSEDTATGQRKPSLMDKLNPKVDADGDGKKGLLS